MSVDDLYLVEGVITGEDRDLESGDNPDERSKRKTNVPEENDDDDRDLESGDNPAERRRGI